MPIPNEKSPQSCRATTSRGKPCRAYAVAGSEYCFTHSPAHERVRAAARRRGGKNRPRPSNPVPFPETDITNARGLTAFVAQLIQETWTLKPSLNRARTLAYLVKVQNEMIQRAAAERSTAAYKARMAELGPLLPRSIAADVSDDLDEIE